MGENRSLTPIAPKARTLSSNVDSLPLRGGVENSYKLESHPLVTYLLLMLMAPFLLHQ